MWRILPVLLLSPYTWVCSRIFSGLTFRTPWYVFPFVSGLGVTCPCVHRFPRRHFGLRRSSALFSCGVRSGAKSSPAFVSHCQSLLRAIGSPHLPLRGQFFYLVDLHPPVLVLLWRQRWLTFFSSAAKAASHGASGLRSAGRPNSSIHFDGVDAVSERGPLGARMPRLARNANPDDEEAMADNITYFGDPATRLIPTES